MFKSTFKAFKDASGLPANELINCVTVNTSGQQSLYIVISNGGGGMRIINCLR